MRKSGHTVIEALVGTLCLMVLTGMLLAATSLATEEAQRLQTESNMQQIAQAYTAYMNDNDGFFPLNADYQSYPEYHPGGTLPQFMQRHPDAILDGPHAGPWDFTDKLAVYLADPGVFIDQRWIENHAPFSDEVWYEYEPYHPTTHTSFVQLSVLGYGPGLHVEWYQSKRVEDLPAQPAHAFVMGLGTTAQIGGSGIFDNVDTLVPESCMTSFVHSKSTHMSKATQGDDPTVYELGLNPYLFADGHVEFLGYWDVWDNSRAPSSPGAQDGMYYMEDPDPSLTRFPNKVQ